MTDPWIPRTIRLIGQTNEETRLIVEAHLCYTPFHGLWAGFIWDHKRSYLPELPSGLSNSILLPGTSESMEAGCDCRDSRCRSWAF